MSGLTKKKKYVGPYASLREYLEALEKFGRVLHINEVDQDQYEATKRLEWINKMNEN